VTPTNCRRKMPAAGWIRPCPKPRENDGRTLRYNRGPIRRLIRRAHGRAARRIAKPVQNAPVLVGRTHGELVANSSWPMMIPARIFPQADYRSGVIGRDVLFQ